MALLHAPIAALSPVMLLPISRNSPGAFRQPVKLVLVNSGGHRAATRQNAEEIIFLYDVGKVEIRPGERSTWQGAAVPTRLTLAILFFARNDFRPLPFCARALAALGCERMVRARRSISKCF